MPRLTALICTTLVLLSGPLSGAVPDLAARWEAIKAEATPEELYRLLFALPKGGDLHNHLGGSFFPHEWYEAATNPQLLGRANYFVRIRHADLGLADLEPSQILETIREADWQKRPLEDQANFKPLASLNAEEKAAWLSLFQLDQPGEGRYTFFAGPKQRLGALGQDRVIMGELLVRLMQEFGAEGVRYIETQTSPFRTVFPDGSPCDPEDTAAYYEWRLGQPDALATGVEVRFQLTVLRFAADAVQQVRDYFAFCARHPRFVGINMAGIEEKGLGYPQRFTEVFREMRRTHPGVGISIHAGEMDGPNTNVRDTLLLGATRIGHGVTLIQDPDLLLRFRGKPWMVEINLISNHLLEYTPDLNLHPFPEYLRLGVPVCLNTDDRGWWGSNFTDEYYVAVTRFNLSWSELSGLARTSLEHAFLDEPTRTRLLADYEQRLAAFAERIMAPDWRAAGTDVHFPLTPYGQRFFQP